MENNSNNNNNSSKETKQHNAYWFTHSYNASNDKKLLIIRSKLGFEGIGIYWSIVEHMYNNNGLLEEDFVDVYCDLNKLEREKLDLILKVAFTKTKKCGVDVYYAKRISEELAAKDACIERARKAANKRWSKEKETRKDISDNPLIKQYDRVIGGRINE